VKRARLLPVEFQHAHDGQSEHWDCDRHDQPPLTASFSTVSTSGQERTPSSDSPAILPVIDTIVRSKEAASTSEHHQPRNQRVSETLCK
jgi:hypothetical protein